MAKGTYWDRNSMVFSNKYCKPKGMKDYDWYQNNVPRIWKSKANEPPSEFIYRILKDMEQSGANIIGYLLQEIEKGKKKGEIRGL